MKLLELIEEDYIWVDEKLNNEKDVFKKVNEKARTDNKVKETFFEALCARENEFPTGLNLGQYAIAIPHTDSEHVLSEFVAILIPEKNVTFQGMEDPEEEIHADIIFVMALKESNHHLTILREIMSLIQNEEIIQELIEVKNKKEIIQILERVDFNE